MKTLLTILAALVLSLSAIAKAAEGYPVMLHVVSFAYDGMLYHAEVSNKSQLPSAAHFLLNAVSLHSFNLEIGHDYPARLAERHGRQNFQIQTPDGKAHWFEITGTKEAR
jgi:hypothetical protein